MKPLLRTRIKVCGFTRESDARTAIDLGVDALGFVFYQQSKRVVTAETLKWLKHLPPFVQLVGLFVNPDKATVDTLLKQLPLDMLQFHGDESADFCQQFQRPYIKAVPMQKISGQAAENYMQQYPTARGLLLDNYGAGEIGGSGKAFDWQKIPTRLSLPLIMAGGLNEQNVGEVIHHYHPYAVDVSSGVERSPGVKCPDKMAAFIQAVQQSDARNATV